MQEQKTNTKVTPTTLAIRTPRAQVKAPLKILEAGSSFEESQERQVKQVKQTRRQALKITCGRSKKRLCLLCLARFFVLRGYPLYIYISIRVITISAYSFLHPACRFLRALFCKPFSACKHTKCMQPACTLAISMHACNQHACPFLHATHLFCNQHACLQSQRGACSRICNANSAPLSSAFSSRIAPHACEKRANLWIATHKQVLQCMLHILQCKHINAQARDMKHY